MRAQTEAFDHWIRTDFVAMNSELEALYARRDDPMDVDGVGESVKQALSAEGRALILPLLAEGRTSDGFRQAFALLGNVGLYLGALRRHELTNPDREDRSPFPEASALALHIGASIGMAPRFATAHLATHNLAVNGVRKSFTHLQDEFLFIDENTRAILSFQRAADAVERIAPLGVTSPIALHLFRDAVQAIDDVVAINTRLFTSLNVDQFFFHVRPYYKPYRVGRQVYRGANAGDFAGINILDLALGLCQASDPYYAQILHEKLLYMLPEDQQRLRVCMSRRSLLDEFLALLGDHGREDWFQTNARAFLILCDRFGHTAEQHHNALIRRFIEGPAERMNARHQVGLTASGPPLAAMLSALETLRDYRCAAPRTDVPTRHADIARLKQAVAYTG